MKLIKLNLSKPDIKENAINECLKVLKLGGLIVCPSDTVYGLMADAENDKAIKKLTEFKNRPAGKPISIFVADFSMLKEYVDTSNVDQNILEELLPGPFTLILPAKKKASNLLKSEKGTLGVRIPDNDFITGMVKKYGKAVSATSANLAGQPPHYSIKSLFKQLSVKKKRLIDLVIDAGILPRNKPSTLVDLTTAKIKIIRKGDIVFKTAKTYVSQSEKQTKKIAQFIFSKKLGTIKNKPLIFIIEGELGVGKTIFIKGIGELLGIKNIVSPTFVIYYEYSVYSVPANPEGSFFKNKLVHIDLYNIQEADEFKYLGLEKYLKPGNLLCFEWGEKAGEMMDLLKRKGKIVYVKMKYIDERKREIIIKN